MITFNYYYLFITITMYTYTYFIRKTNEHAMHVYWGGGMAAENCIVLFAHKNECREKRQKFGTENLSSHTLLSRSYAIHRGTTTE